MGVKFVVQAHFAKYKKGINLSEMINVINVLKSNGSTPIEYTIIADYNFKNCEIEHMLKVGSLKDYSQISDSCLLSTTNNAGNWQCILINNFFILYTAGSADILYYSFK